MTETTKELIKVVVPNVTKEIIHAHYTNSSSSYALTDLMKTSIARDIAVISIKTMEQIRIELEKKSWN